MLKDRFCCAIKSNIVNGMIEYIWMQLYGTIKLDYDVMRNINLDMIIYDMQINVNMIMMIYDIQILTF